MPERYLDYFAEAIGNGLMDNDILEMQKAEKYKMMAVFKVVFGKLLIFQNCKLAEQIGLRWKV